MAAGAGLGPGQCRQSVTAVLRGPRSAGAGRGQPAAHGGPARLARVHCLAWELPQPRACVDKRTKGLSRLSCWQQRQLPLTGEGRPGAGCAVPGAARPAPGGRCAGLYNTYIIRALLSAGGWEGRPAVED